MIKKFSRSKILAMVTTGAIVVSTAFSFAAWNKLSDKASGSITLDQTIKVQATGFTTASKTEGATKADAATYTGEVKFTVENADTAKDKLTLVPVITKSGTPLTDQFDVKIMKNTTEIVGGVDTAIQNADNAYQVSITPKSTLTEQEVDALAEQTIELEVTGTLSAK